MAARTSRRAIGWTFVALLVLLALTVGAAHVPLGAAGPVVAVGIACAKAVLVGLVFMQLARRGGVTRLFAVGGLVWLALLFSLTLVDYATRGAGEAEGRSWSEEGTPAGAPIPQPERESGG